VSEGRASLGEKNINFAFLHASFIIFLIMGNIFARKQQNSFNLLLHPRLLLIFPLSLSPSSPPTLFERRRLMRFHAEENLIFCLGRKLICKRIHFNRNGIAGGKSLGFCVEAAADDEVSFIHELLMLGGLER
jgi:hypothetical protein